MLPQKAPLFLCRVGSRAEEKAAQKQDEGLAPAKRVLCGNTVLVCRTSLGGAGLWGEGQAKDSIGCVVRQFRKL